MSRVFSYKLATVLRKSVSVDTKFVFLDSTKAARFKQCGTSDRFISTTPRLKVEEETAVNVFATLSGSKPVLLFQNLLIGVHDFTGLPWWCTIVLTTIVTRTVIVLPMAIHQHYTVARLENVQEEMKPIENKLHKQLSEEAHKNGWNDKELESRYKKAVRAEKDKLIVKYNCHPAKMSLLTLIQVPVWATVTTALRNLVFGLPNCDAAADIIRMQLSVGGFLWVPNLLLPDSTHILSILVAVFNLCIFKVQRISKIQKKSAINTGVGGIIALGMLSLSYLTFKLNACLVLYWATSSFYGLCQNLILLSPKVRTFLRIPLTPTTRQHPFKHIAKVLGHRLKFFTY